MVDPNKTPDKKEQELIPSNQHEDEGSKSQGLINDIQTPINELKQRYGEVIYDVTADNKSLDDALIKFDENSGKLIEAVSSKDPGKIRTAIESAKASREAMKIAHDRLIQKREAQELKFENATGEDRVEIDRYNQRRAAIQAEASAHASEKWANYVSAPISGILGGTLGGVMGGLGKGLGSFWYGLRGTKDAYQQKKAERGFKGKK